MIGSCVVGKELRDREKEGQDILVVPFILATQTTIVTRRTCFFVCVCVCALGYDSKNIADVESWMSTHPIDMTSPEKTNGPGHCFSKECYQNVEVG